MSRKRSHRHMSIAISEEEESEEEIVYHIRTDSDDELDAAKRAKEEFDENEEQEIDAFMTQPVNIQKTNSSTTLDDDESDIEIHSQDSDNENSETLCDFPACPSPDGLAVFDDDDQPTEESQELEPNSDDELYDEMLLTEKYRPTRLSGLEAMVRALMMQVKKDLSNEVAQNIAEYSNDTIGYNNITSTNYNSMVSKVPHSFKPKQVYYFFSKCGRGLVGPVTNLKLPQASCNLGCKECRIEKPSELIHNHKRYFIYISIRDWLSYLVQLLFDKLRFASPEQLNTSNYHDLCNCQRYHDIAKPYLSDKNDVATLTLILTWDGVQAPNAGSRSLWPVAAYLTELPFQDRIINSMLLALYASQKAPDLLFSPLISELVILAVEPMEITVKGKIHKFRVKVLHVIADEPGRSSLLNMVGHNGHYGCNLCEINIEKKNKKFNCMCFRTLSSKSFPDRTDSDWRKNASKGKEGKPWKGIKGNCEMMRLDYIDLPTLCAPEPMHSMYLGVVKAILTRWFGKDNDGKVWYSLLGKSEKYLLNLHCLTLDNQKTLDSRLSLIKFPKRVLRSMPKLCPNYVSNLKSMEYEIILFYGFVCVDGLIEARRFHNFKQLAWILSRLSSRNIMNKRDLRQEEAEVDRFLKSFDSIYNQNEGYMWRINVHFLSHICDMVKLYGPLTVQSAYYTESTVGEISRLVQSGTYIPKQAINKFILKQSIISAVSKMILEPTCSTKFLSKSHSCYPTLFPSDPWSASKMVVVKKYDQALYVPTGDALQFCDPEQQYKSVKSVGWTPEHTNQSQTLCTTLHNKTNAKRTNNHCVKAKNGKYFIIETILQQVDSSEVLFLGYELLKCEPLPLYDPKVPFQKELINTKGMQSISLIKFDYVSTFSDFSKKLSLLDVNTFLELATYADINKKKYVFDLFNRHL